MGEGQNGGSTRTKTAVVIESDSYSHRETPLFVCLFIDPTHSTAQQYKRTVLNWSEYEKLEDSTDIRLTI